MNTGAGNGSLPYENMTYRLYDGRQIAYALYRSERNRLLLPAQHQRHPARRPWLVRRINRMVRHSYGQKCHKCGKFVEIQWEREPVSRALQGVDPARPGKTYGYFHLHCWGLYKRKYANQRRRQRYNAAKQNRQPRSSPALAIQNAPPRQIAVVQPPFDGPMSVVQVGQHV